MDPKELVAAVREHARKNYNHDGWDYVVEAYDDEDILDTVGSASTVDEAIRLMHEEVKTKHDYEMDVRAEIF